MRQLLTRVPDELHARLVAQAAREGRSITSLVVEVLSEALDGKHLDRRSRLRARAGQLGLRTASSSLQPTPHVGTSEVAAVSGVGPFIDAFLAEDRDWDRYTGVDSAPPADDRTAPADSDSPR